MPSGIVHDMLDQIPRIQAEESMQRIGESLYGEGRAMSASAARQYWRNLQRMADPERARRNTVDTRSAAAAVGIGFQSQRPPAGDSEASSDEARESHADGAKPANDAPHPPED